MHPGDMKDIDEEEGLNIAESVFVRMAELMDQKRVNVDQVF